MNNPTDATGPQEAAEANTCPPWCQDHEEPDHASKDVAIGPMLVRLYGATGGEPVVDTVRDARLVDHDRPLTLAEARALSKELATAVARAEAGHNTSTEAKPVPSWLSALPCPSWCAWPEDHGERDSYDDRVHTARPVPDIVMTSAAWLDGSGRKDDLPDVVSACLHQHYREREPRIQVEVNERVTGIELTPDEAEAFGDMLLKLAAIARTK